MYILCMYSLLHGQLHDNETLGLLSFHLVLLACGASAPLVQLLYMYNIGFEFAGGKFICTI